MRKPSVFITVLLASLFLAKASMAAEADPIKIYSNNPHYLVYKDKPIILIGDSLTQGWFETGSNFNYRGYVDALASRGINILMIWSYIGASASQQQSDSRIGYDAPEIWPWIGSPDQRNFDLTKLNQAYFDRLKELVAYAEAKGVIVLITVHDGWAKGRWSAHPFNSSNGGPLSSSSSYVDLSISANKNAQELFVDKLITELSPYGNIIYEIFNEGEWYDSSLRNSHEQHFLQFFNARTNKLLMTNTDHISGDNPYNDSKVDIISYHGGWTNRFSGFQNEFNRTPIKNYFLSEPVPGWDGSNVTLDNIRNSIWTSAMAGAGWVNQNDTSFGWDPNSAMASKSNLRDQAYDIAGYAAKFFNTFGVKFWEMSPNGSLASTGVAMVNAGQEYVIYQPGSGSFTVNLSAGAGSNFNVKWYNPRTGQLTSVGTVSGGSTATAFNPPSSGDWVLWLVKTLSQEATLPYPQSDFIDITFDFNTQIQKGNGSDQWPMTWADDGNIYAVYGDGTGWDVSADRSMGITRIGGTPPNLTGTDLWGIDRSVQNRKPAGIIAEGNQKMYVFWQTADDNWDGAYGSYSADNGQTLSDAGKVFSLNNDGVLPQGIAQFGPGYYNLPQGVDSNYFYIYLSDRRNGNGDGYGKNIYLARVPRPEIFNRSSYSYYNGLDGSGNPIWSPDFSQKQTVLYDSNGMEYHVIVTYDPALNRFLLAKGHGTNKLGIFESPNLWGPWKTVYYEEFKDSYWKFTYQFPQGWMGTLTNNQQELWMAWSGWPEYDNVNFIRAIINLKIQDTTPPSTPTNLASTTQTDTSVSLSWSASSDPESGISKYIIYKDNIKAGETTTTSYTDLSLAPETTYTYQVSSVNTAGLESARSASLQVTTKPYIPGSGLIISNLSVASAKTYQVVDKGLNIGAATYIDRTYTFTSIPNQLQGSTYIKTANEDKALTGAAFLSFDVNQQATVYVAHDNRITPKPSWLASFTDTGDDIANDDTTFSVYSKDYPAGKITLGANEGSGGSMYFVIVAGKGGTPSLKGDVNSDSSVDSIDLQALVNHILGTQDYGSNADVNSDGSVDALDVQGVVNIILGG